MSNLYGPRRLGDVGRAGAGQKLEKVMKYMLSICEDHAVYAGGPESAAFRKIVEAHQALVGDMIKAGVFVHGTGLLGPETATTLRKRGGKHSIHDGPFAETKEQLGGFYIVEVADLDAALAWARKIPLAADGSIEVRPAIPD